MKPLLYQIVDKDTLHNMIFTLHSCINLPVQAIDENGVILEACGDRGCFCRSVQPFLPPGDTCEKIHINASKRAVSLGETYIFNCHTNLSHIVFPLITNTSFLGSILVGPFLMDEPDSVLLSDLSEKYHISTAQTLELYDDAKTIPIITPSMANHIRHLIYYLFCNLISESKEELKNNNKKLLQQSRINESIQRYKGISSENASYPYEKEKELISKVKTGNASEAKAILNDLLGYVLFTEGSSLDITKARAVELCSILSRTAIEGGAPADNILKLNNAFLNNLQQVQDMDTICYKLQEIVVTFADSIFNYVPSKNSEIIKDAMLYISNNFQTDITLTDVAKHVHLHPTYFSTLFKQSIGFSFKEYISIVRIEESKRLLLNTDFSIIDIAVATGFEDQSYFAKVFKKITGMTPKQYRSQ